MFSVSCLSTSVPSFPSICPAALSIHLCPVCVFFLPSSAVCLFVGRFWHSASLLAGLHKLHLNRKKKNGRGDLFRALLYMLEYSSVLCGILVRKSGVCHLGSGDGCERVGGSENRLVVHHRLRSHHWYPTHLTHLGRDLQYQVF